MIANFEDSKVGDYLSITSSDIDFTSIINQCRSYRCGAVSSFLGTTRDLFDGKVVTRLEYECYADMSIEYLKLLCNNIRNRWKVENICIQHKVGLCPLGDISVVIAISSEHRTESLQAVEFAINELKKTVPIWKKEYYADEQCMWKENKEFLPSGI